MLHYFQNKQVRILQEVPERFVRKRYLKPLLSQNRLVGLIGPRGVGKTTLLLQYLKQNFKVGEYLYLSADDVYFADTKLYDLAEEFVINGGTVMAVDEIHRYGNWAQEVKNIYDSFPRLFVRFSGSSMLNILYEKYDLSRRCVTVVMDTLSFREFIEISKGTELPGFALDEILERGSEIGQELALSNSNLFSDFRDYLKYGAYPFFMEDKDSFKNKLFNALEKIINEDIPSCHRIEYSHISVFKKLIAKLVEAGLPYKVNVAGLAADLGVSQPTLTTYLAILKDTKVFRPVKKYTTRITKKPAKLLFDNTSILHAYSDEFGVDVNIGTERETFFAGCFAEIYYSDIGDFRVGDTLFEIGGRKKTIKQIAGIENGYLVVDTDYTSDSRRIPLWLFGLIKDNQE